MADSPLFASACDEDGKEIAKKKVVLDKEFVADPPQLYSGCINFTNADLNYPVYFQLKSRAGKLIASSRPKYVTSSTPEKFTVVDKCP